MQQIGPIEQLSGVPQCQLFSYLSRECLQLVEQTCSLIENVDLSDVCIIGAQHILPTTLRMFESLFKRGFPRTNLFLIGKCYSTDFQTFRELKKRGIYVCKSSNVFEKNTSFDCTYSENIKDFIADICPKIISLKPKKLIILDDGGELISIASEMLWPNIEIVGVEQTSSGYEKLKKQTHAFPIINVARSKAKLLYESPIIATTAINALLMHIDTVKLQKSKVLILGNGSIGRAIESSLKDSCCISSYDITHIDKIPQHEYFRNNLYKFDIVIGCTGNSSITPEYFSALKPGVVLVSVSSSDREFSAQHLRQMTFDQLQCHDSFTVRNITVLNGGFPVNFSGLASATDPEIFELTRALLIGAILEGLYNCPKTPGLKLFDGFIHNSIIGFFISKYIIEST